MIKLKNRTIYVGNSLEKFNTIRTLLEENHIPYKYKIHNHNAAFISPGIGTGRSVGGNLSNVDNNIYEILVSKEDMEKARFLSNF